MVQKVISVLQTIMFPERSVYVSFAISQDMLLKNSWMAGDLKLHDGHVASL